MSREAADALTQKALVAGGWADMRPIYRTMLRNLKLRDPSAFEEASRRFASEIEPAISAGEREPVDAWVDYGAWIATRLGGGRLVKLDETGLAEPGEARPQPGNVLLFLPESGDGAAIPILQPAQPSAAQEAALELLTR